MFTPVFQGNVVIDNTLNAYFDFGDPACFLPAQGTGSITAGTTFNNLAPNYATTTGSINGAVNWSPAYGGCMNLTNRNTSQLSYTAGLSASFTTQIVLTSGTDASPSGLWNNDAGGYPGYRANDGLVMAPQTFGGTTYVVPILWAGASPATLALEYPGASGWRAYSQIMGVMTFRTNGNNSHSMYTNTITSLKTTVTTSRVRGNSPVGTIYLNRDSAVGDRYGIGRIAAYLHYNRNLSDDEIYQNAQYFLNRLGTK